MSMRVAITVMSDRVPDQRLKDCPIHIRKLFDVEAALSCRVSSEFRQEGFCLAVSSMLYRTAAALRGEKQVSGISPSRPLSYL
jgi:hypothetical protein